MDNARMLEWVLQTCGGIILLITTGIAGFALKQIFDLRADHSALEAKVDARDEEVQRRLSGIMVWLEKIDSKLDRIAEHH